MKIIARERQLKNSLGIILDRRRRVVSRKILMELFTPKGDESLDFSYVMGLPRDKEEKDQVRIPSDHIWKMIEDMVILSDKAVEFWEDKEKAKTWLTEGNTYFFGKSPLQVCLAGNLDVVLNLLEGFSERMDGFAF
jgi:Protein of unknown function (DUF2384)